MKTIARKTKISITNPSEQEAKTLVARPYARRLTPDESGGYTATIQEFPGCIADGDSPTEALHNLEAAAVSWVEAQIELGQPIPEPISLYGYSGKLALRIPRGLHKRVAEMATSEGASINQFITTALATYVGAKAMTDRLIKELAPVVAHSVRLERFANPIIIVDVNLTRGATLQERTYYQAPMALIGPSSTVPQSMTNG